MKDWQPDVCLVFFHTPWRIGDRLARLGIDGVVSLYVSSKDVLDVCAALRLLGAIRITIIPDMDTAPVDRWTFPPQPRPT
jgi:hypothetical protein